jgi:hypothetical protein
MLKIHDKIITFSLTFEFHRMIFLLFQRKRYASVEYLQCAGSRQEERQTAVVFAANKTEVTFMEVIILIALIFVILNLANKYLKVPRDGNQRYDGINNRFYGEGYTGDTPVPPADAEDQVDGREEQQDETADEGMEFGGDEAGTGVGGQADDVTSETGTGDQPEYGTREPGEAGKQEYEPASNMVDQPENRQNDSPETGSSAKVAPAGDTAFYGNTGNTTGVVIDTEVHIDATMPQEPGKS